MVEFKLYQPKGNNLYEATPWSGKVADAHHILAWIHENGGHGTFRSDASPDGADHLVIMDREKKRSRAVPGDYIVRYADGFAVIKGPSFVESFQMPEEACEMVRPISVYVGTGAFLIPHLPGSAKIVEGHLYDNGIIQIDLNKNPAGEALLEYLREDTVRAHLQFTIEQKVD